MLMATVAMVLNMTNQYQDKNMSHNKQRNGKNEGLVYIQW